jgi:hypothetical protein
MNEHLSTFVLLLAITAAGALRADGPADNHPENVRRIPALGIELEPPQRTAIKIELDELQQAIAELRQSKNPLVKELLPDVQVHHKAVHDALVHRSFTYREYAYLNNARQVPKLPDWAIVDVRTPPDSLWPGKILAADFFDEQWQLKALSN